MQRVCVCFGGGSFTLIAPQAEHSLEDHGELIGRIKEVLASWDEQQLGDSTPSQAFLEQSVAALNTVESTLSSSYQQDCAFLAKLADSIRVCSRHVPKSFFNAFLWSLQDPQWRPYVKEHAATPLRDWGLSQTAAPMGELDKRRAIIHQSLESLLCSSPDRLGFRSVGDQSEADSLRRMLGCTLDELARPMAWGIRCFWLTQQGAPQLNAPITCIFSGPCMQPSTTSKQRSSSMASVMAVASRMRVDVLMFSLQDLTTPKEVSDALCQLTTKFLAATQSSGESSRSAGESSPFIVALVPQFYSASEQNAAPDESQLRTPVIVTSECEPFLRMAMALGAGPWRVALWLSGCSTSVIIQQDTSPQSCHDNPLLDAVLRRTTVAVSSPDVREKLLTFMSKHLPTTRVLEGEGAAPLPRPLYGIGLERTIDASDALCDSSVCWVKASYVDS